MPPKAIGRLSALCFYVRVVSTGGFQPDPRRGGPHMDRKSQVGVRLKAHRAGIVTISESSRLLGGLRIRLCSKLLSGSECLYDSPGGNLWRYCADSVICSWAVFTHAGRPPWRLRSVASRFCSGWARAPRNPWLWSHTRPSSCLSSTR